jgi:hypothetical protein
LQKHLLPELYLALELKRYLTVAATLISIQQRLTLSLASQSTYKVRTSLSFVAFTGEKASQEAIHRLLLFSLLSKNLRQ